MVNFVSNSLISQNCEFTSNKSTQIEETRVKDVCGIPDEGWDDDVLIALENGIVLESKWYNDPFFRAGDSVTLEFKDNGSKLTVTRNGDSFGFYHRGDNLYRRD